MSIVFVGSGLNAPSQEWMRRMLYGLWDDVSMVITNDGSATKLLNGMRVRDMPGVPPYWLRAANRLRMTRRCPWSHYGNEKMKEYVSRDSVTSVFVHFLTTAVQYLEAWEGVDKPVYVHCHGYDVTWKKRNYEGHYSHPEDYEDRVKALPENVRFIANSVATKTRLNAIGIEDSRIDVKYLGVPMPERARVHEDNVAPNILYVGRLVDCKGPDRVIQAFDLACKRVKR